MTRPVLLDLFCGAGGAAVGYHRAGFDVVGVDLAPQPRYPFPFIRADALAIDWRGFDAIHASPPCQRYSTITADRAAHPDLYAATLERIRDAAQVWIVENVPRAPSRSGVVLCGSMFGLRVRRHRIFETSHVVLAPPCRHSEQGRPVLVAGNGGACDARHSLRLPRNEWPALMGMPWATPDEIAQAIPPAYTEHVGAQLRAYVQGAAA